MIGNGACAPRKGPMEVSEIKYLLEFTIWADGKVLEGARHVSAEQLRAIHAMPFESIFVTLVHVMGAQQVWLSRWQGTSPAALVTSDRFADLDQLNAAWTAVHSDLRNFVAGLRAGQLGEKISYRDTRGINYTHPLQWTILHVLNHSTEHRSQIAAMLAMSGYDVGWLDIIYYMREVVAPA